MVLSLKANKKRILAVIILIVLVVVGVTVLPKITEEPVKYEGGTESERLSFLESFGYTVAEDPVDVRTVTIPKEFSEIYTEYNKMQKAQGFDLLPYRGKEVKQYIYLITNYSGVEAEVHATMLVYQNIIIGGDISSAEINGFMHGFSKDSAHFGSDGKFEAKTENGKDAAESEKTEITETEGSQQETEETAEILNEVNEDIYPTD